MSTDNMNAADINKKEPGKKPAKKFSLMMGRHRGRLAQIPIYLGKDFRMFIFQTDWKVLPMSALIAGMIGFVLYYCASDLPDVPLCYAGDADRARL